MFAATAAGIFNKVEDAMAAMGQGFDATYFPNPANTAIYARRYEAYKSLGNFTEMQLS
jgi:L-ribulokinase